MIYHSNKNIYAYGGKQNLLNEHNKRKIFLCKIMDNHRPLIIFSNSLSQFYYDGSIYSSPITLSESETGGFKHVSDLQNNDGNKVKFSDFCYWSPNDKILAGRVLNNFYLM